METETNSQEFTAATLEVQINYSNESRGPDTTDLKLKKREVDSESDIPHGIFSLDFSFLGGTKEMKDSQSALEDVVQETNRPIKTKSGLKKLLFKTAQNIYKCNQCSYQTMYEGRLTRHFRGHNTLYKCDKCDYKTRRRYDLKRHVLQHKDPKEVFIFNCTKCDFQADQRFKLTRHSIIHNKDGVEKHVCSECGFQTIHKKVLQRHVLLHKNPQDVVMFKCNECSYESARSDDLKKHSLQHKESKNLLYCSWCDYQTEVEHKLMRHVIIHEGSGKSKSHVCSECGYKAWNKGALYWHRFTTHKDTEVLKCDQCSFQTIHKRSLKDHILIHKKPGDIDMHKCEQCSYQTFRKRDLKKHFFIHTKPGGDTKYRCEKCEYQTVNKNYFKRHRQRHESAQL